jgi:hypothetical protein
MKRRERIDTLIDAHVALRQKEKAANERRLQRYVELFAVRSRSRRGRSEITPHLREVPIPRMKKLFRQ